MSTRIKGLAQSMYSGIEQNDEEAEGEEKTLRQPGKQEAPELHQL